MRTDPRYTRVRQMLTCDDVPKGSNGGPLLCHRCQRSVYFAGGFLKLLVKHVKREAAY
jgi:hypothetical protein